MLKFYNDTKVYVHCPAGVVTGGAELLHQLVSFLRNHGRDAYIVYFGDYDGLYEVPFDYLKYTIATSSIVENSAHNIEVFYEGIFYMLKRNRDTQTFLWWISVDNFYLTSLSYLHPKDIWAFDKRNALKWFLKWLKRSIKNKRNLFLDLLSLEKLARMNAVCGYQAEYIHHFLLNHNFYELVPLKDYINEEHFATFDVAKKKDLVVYNPSKGLEFTKKIMAIMPDVNWIPLQGFSRSELMRILDEAKLYIDFGYHPGKDRLPRECAMHGCCVITGKQGSARFYEDVPIPSAYKFDEENVSLEDIAEKIRVTLKGYDSYIADFANYRKAIKNEKQEFEEQMIKLFEL